MRGEDGQAGRGVDSGSLSWATAKAQELEELGENNAEGNVERGNEGEDRRTWWVRRGEVK